MKLSDLLKPDRNTPLRPHLNQILRAYNSHGKTALVAVFLKNYPNGKVMVRNLRTLDMLLLQGIQPSQVIVSGEFTNTSRFDMLQGIGS